MAKSKKPPISKGIAQLLSEDAPKKKAPKRAAGKKEQIQEIPDTSNLQLIETNIILPDPQQPRKESSFKQNMELAESVREHGVLQPIMVRPNGFGQYIVIYGHRRLWAADQTGLTHIWCQVRERLEEHEIREIQLIENIQRADMHPMEEAAAFLELSENGSSPDEIGAKVGKSVYYIRQRMKLNNLEPSWVDAYKAGKVRHKDALQIATLGKEAQMDLFEDYDPEVDEFILEDWNITRCQSKLSNAPFNLSEDYEGLPKCSQCQFNTGVNSLFPDQDPEAYCKNPKCFELKEAYAFEKELEKIKEDPAAILLSVRYVTDEEELQTWKSADLEVYDRNDFAEMEEPDIDDYDLDDEDDGPENKIQYEKDLQEYKDLIVQPNTVRAFKMNGNNKGEIVYGTLRKKSTPIGLPENEVSTSDDTKAEINRIKDKEKRAKELDGEKVWAKIAELVTIETNREVLFNMHPLSQAELYAAAKAIENKVNWNNKSWIKEYIGKIEPTITDLGLNGLLRLFLCDVLISTYGSHLQKDSNNQVAYSILKAYFPDKVNTYEIEQQEVAEKRAERVNKRIADLKKKEA